jgi:hypothetical protein
MTEWFWSQFIPGFCKVQFLCYDGTPNFFGWSALAWGGLLAFGVVAAAFVDW